MPVADAVVAAAVDAVVAAAVVVLAVVAGVVLVCRPTTCSSDCSSVPNKLCVAAVGDCADASLVEELSVEFTFEPCLCPCEERLAGGSAADEGRLKLVTDDIGYFLGLLRCDVDSGCNQGG